MTYSPTLSSSVRRAPSGTARWTPLFALVVATGGGVVGAALDAIFLNDVRTLFTVGFSIGTALALWFVRRGEVFRTFVWIPLIYIAILFLAGFVHHPGQTYTDWLILAVVFRAPVIFITTAVGLVVAVLRRIAGR